MRITLNEQNRKPLVKLVSEFTGEEARYLFTPTYAFQIGGYTVTREGNIDTPEGLDTETLCGLVDALTAAGYQPEVLEQEAETETADAEPETREPDESAENSTADEAVESEPAEMNGKEMPDPETEPSSENVDIKVESETAAEETSETEAAELDLPISLTVSVPLDKVNAGHLTSLLDAKGRLIRKALGIPATPIEITEEAVLFPWFSHTMDADTSKACTDFISALCTMSLNQKRVTAKEKEVSNEKYAFRCFLLRLGFIGPDFKTDRKILLQNLSGSSAFKSGRRNSAEGGDPHEEA